MKNQKKLSILSFVSLLLALPGCTDWCCSCMKKETKPTETKVDEKKEETPKVVETHPVAPAHPAMPTHPAPIHPIEPAHPVMPMPEHIVTAPAPHPVAPIHPVMPMPVAPKLP